MIEFWQTNNPSRMTPRETARAVEADGWDGQVFTDSQSLTGDPYVLMGAWAMETERLKLEPFVTNPVTRHPTVTAAAAMTLQTISGGRAVLGIGRGDSALAYLGYAPVRPPDFEASLHDLQVLLRGEEIPFGNTPLPGDVPPLDTIALGNWPTAARIGWMAQDLPKVPLDASVTGPKVIALCAPLVERLTFSVGAMADRLEWALGLAREARAEHGLTDDGASFGAQIVVICHPDLDVAMDSAANLVPSLARFQVMQTGLQGPRSGDDEESYAAIRGGYDMTKHASRSGTQGKLGGASISREFIHRFAIVGPPDHCVERLRELIGFGIDRFIVVGPNLHPEAAAPGRTLFASEVIPAIRAG